MGGWGIAQRCPSNPRPGASLRWGHQPPRGRSCGLPAIGGASSRPRRTASAPPISRSNPPRRTSALPPAPPHFSSSGAASPLGCCRRQTARSGPTPPSASCQVLFPVRGSLLRKLAPPSSFPKLARRSPEVGCLQCWHTSDNPNPHNTFRPAERGLHRLAIRPTAVRNADWGFSSRVQLLLGVRPIQFLRPLLRNS